MFKGQNNKRSKMINSMWVVMREKEICKRKILSLKSIMNTSEKNKLFLIQLIKEIKIVYVF